jgi:hypothetical protein
VCVLLAQGVDGASQWAQQAYVKASNTGADDGFGVAMAVDGDTMVVGASYEDSAATGVNGDDTSNGAIDSGAAYVYVRSGSTWALQAYLKASNTQAGDEFGTAVAISGNTIVVSARGEDSGATGANGDQSDNSVEISGALYVFVRSGTTWTQQAYLKASNPGINDQLGFSVAISGDTIVAGAQAEDSNATAVNGNQSDNSLTEAGAAYVFVRSGTTWTQQAYLKASNTDEGDQFGLSVGIDGDRIVVGAPGEDSSSTGVNGGENNEGTRNAGAAYVFVRSGTAWTQQAYLKASNTGQFDVFGTAVAISGTTLVVGAPQERSSDGDQNDNSAMNAGAVYVFTQTGTSWGQQAYVKPSNIGAYDTFGAGVALSGDRLVVGAQAESSAATGINGNALDNSLFYAGAAYALLRTGSTWAQQAYIKASNTADQDAFGRPVAISGTTIVVAATGEDSAATGVGGSQSSDLASGAGAAYVYYLAPEPTITAAPTTLRFTATKNGAAGAISAVTVAQTVTVGYTGATLPIWSATADQPWIEITRGAGTGAGAFTVGIVNPGNVIGGLTELTGTITLAAANTGASAAVPIALTVHQTLGTTSPPFGQVDTPVQNAAGVQGAIGVTGWALDDIGVSGVQVFRNCLLADAPSNCQTILTGTPQEASVVFVGDAAFLAGARPDVAAGFTTFPQAHRAGWGMLMLTPMLPDVTRSLAYGGQGPLTVYVVATDIEGNKVLLGRSSDPASPDLRTPTAITMENDTIAKPFGSIDTPSLGETISGVIANFGWSLTPDTNTVGGEPGDIEINPTGTTMFVFIDDLPVAPVAYNQCRVPGFSPASFCADDVSNIFGNPTPQPSGQTRTENLTRFRNLDVGRAPIGAYVLDTRTLTNGLHTIAWSVRNSAGITEGIGSRFFTVLNSGADAAADIFAGRTFTSRASQDDLRVSKGTQSTELIWGRTGFNLGAGWAEMYPRASGRHQVRLQEMGRLELWFGTPVDAAYLRGPDGAVLDLPVGARLDGTRFGWAPPVGYHGVYPLVFVRGNERIDVDVTIAPVARADEDTGGPEIRMHFDAVTSRHRTVQLAGWAYDPRGAIEAGIGAVHVWATKDGATPIFVGEATLNVARPDVAQAHADAPGHAGFSVSATLAPGTYEFTAYVWNVRTARWEDARTVIGTVR